MIKRPLLKNTVVFIYAVRNKTAYKKHSPLHKRKESCLTFSDLEKNENKISQKKSINQ